MSNEKDWLGYTSKGDFAQELFCDYIEETLGYSFVAGDRKGQTLNIEKIESLFQCQYIPAKKKVSGPSVSFYVNGNWTKSYRMPDELMCYKKKNQHTWFEVKNRTAKTLSEKFEKLEDYYYISLYSEIDVYISVIIWEGDGYNIYLKNVKDILNNYWSSRPNDDIPFYLEDFIRITRNPIKP